MEWSWGRQNSEVDDDDDEKLDSKASQTVSNVSVVSDTPA
jgi:hypothetical protein